MISSYIIKQLFAIENKLDMSNVSVIDLGTLDGYISNEIYFVNASNPPFNLDETSQDVKGYICLCTKYTRENGSYVYRKNTDMTLCLTSPFIGGNLAIYDSRFVGKTVTEIKALLSGVLFAYQKS